MQPHITVFLSCSLNLTFLSHTKVHKAYQYRLPWQLNYVVKPCKCTNSQQHIYAMSPFLDMNFLLALSLVLIFRATISIFIIPILISYYTLQQVVNSYFINVYLPFLGSFFFFLPHISLSPLLIMQPLYSLSTYPFFPYVTDSSPALSLCPPPQLFSLHLHIFPLISPATLTYCNLQV